MQMSLSAEDSLLDIQLSPSLRELQLSLGLETLREIAYSLVTEVNSIARLDPKTVAKVDLHEAVKRFEIEIIRTALEKASGNQAKAARMLGVKHTTLNAKVKRYQIRYSDQPRKHALAAHQNNLSA